MIGYQRAEQEVEGVGLSLPVHPVYKMQKFVLSGAQGADSAEGANRAKPFIHRYLELFGL